MKNNPFFPEINGSFGFGCMRLPMANETVDHAAFCDMADAFIAAGFNYFDTAHGYLNGQSEIAIRECVAKRYDRQAFLLTDKLTDPYFEKEEDIRPFFASQLAACGVEYSDFYLMHAQDASNYQKFRRCRAYETAFALKEEGKIRHVGLSFHDKAEVLDQILTDYPAIEIVQIQLNYVDYADSAVDAKRVYEVCAAHNKPVIVMEPIKGGSLINLPPAAQAEFNALGGGSNAAYALRYLASFPQIAMVLSGMSDRDQVQDNLQTMQAWQPLSVAEQAAVERVRDILRNQNTIPCTGCRYCITDNHCPVDILIPDLLAAQNAFTTFHNWNTKYYYHSVLTAQNGKASDCIECGQCEAVCPQHLAIREYLKQTAKTFES